MKKTAKRRHATTQIGVGLSVALALTIAARMLAATAIPGSEFRVNTSTADNRGSLYAVPVWSRHGIGPAV